MTFAGEQNARDVCAWSWFLTHILLIGYLGLVMYWFAQGYLSPQAWALYVALYFPAMLAIPVALAILIESGYRRRYAKPKPVLDPAWFEWI